jgi:CubicO group peptidase (beta-lactamase class C family)
MILRLTLGAAALALLTGCNSDVPEHSGDWVAKLVDSVSTATLADSKTAGLVVAVARGDLILAQQAYGFQDLTHHVPLRPESTFRIGSLTKQFTATAILQLADTGLLSLDDSLTRFLPDFPAPGVTIRHLLTHTSGLASYTDAGAENDEMIRASTSHDVLLGVMAGTPPDAEPGTQWHYNNSGYYLLGLVVEKLSGMQFSEYLESHLFQPLQLDHTGDCELRDEPPELATGYLIVDGRLREADPAARLPTFGAGFLCSTAGDLARWTARLHHSNVIRPRAYQAMITPAVLSDGTSTSYGFGVFVAQAKGRREISHNGRIHGYSAQASYYPDSDITVVVLANTESLVAERVEKAISRRILGLSPPQLPPLTSPDPSLVARLVGTYFDGPISVPVEQDGGQVTLRSPARERLRLRPRNDTVFVQESDPATEFHFFTRGTEVGGFTVVRDGKIYAIARRPPARMCRPCTGAHATPD